MSKYYKAVDVINTLAEQWHFEATIDCPYAADDIEEWKQNARELYADLPTIEVNEDCISREHLKSFAYINKGDFNSVETIREWIDNAPSVVPQTERLCDNCEYYGGGEVCDHPSIGEVEMGGKGDTFPWIKETPKWCPLKDAPSVVPSCQKNRQVERAEGEWITEKGSYEIICSKCEYGAFDKDGEWFKTDYCPHCGAKMKG